MPSGLQDLVTVAALPVRARSAGPDPGVPAGPLHRPHQPAPPLRPHRAENAVRQGAWASTATTSPCRYATSPGPTAAGHDVDCRRADKLVVAGGRGRSPVAYDYSRDGCVEPDPSEHR
ncbi:hypothetical protein QJS66_18255 [Kocuria rhizophila]|nr:hypothetical protein QJS66_18255 [Kocuria rhizophila]